MVIEKNSVVSIHYTLKDDNGEIIESTTGAEPFTYLHADMGLIQGLKESLNGRSVGDKFSVTVPPEMGYGQYNDQNIHKVPPETFKEVENLEVGMSFTMTDQNGGHHRMQVKELGSDSVTLDGNHPLAGKTLNFDVSVEDIREATEEEISHGHVHHPGHEH